MGEDNWVVFNIDSFYSNTTSIKVNFLQCFIDIVLEIMKLLFCVYKPVYPLIWWSSSPVGDRFCFSTFIIFTVPGMGSLVKFHCIIIYLHMIYLQYKGDLHDRKKAPHSWYISGVSHYPNIPGSISVGGKVCLNQNFVITAESTL